VSLSVRRERNGAFTITLDRESAEVLRDLPLKLRAVLSRTDVRDKVVSRLFPKAHDDPKLDAEYRKLLGDELLQRKLESVRVFEESLEREPAAWQQAGRKVKLSVPSGELESWLGFVNDMRLVLGTELDITQDGWEEDFDPNHPQADDFVLLHYLGWLQESLLRAMAGG